MEDLHLFHGIPKVKKKEMKMLSYFLSITKKCLVLLIMIVQFFVEMIMDHFLEEIIIPNLLNYGFVKEIIVDFIIIKSIKTPIKNVQEGLEILN